MRVEVYRNLHKSAWSVRHQGKVIYHDEATLIADARLVVQPAGQARVRREGRKFVHAWTKGERLDIGLAPTKGWRRVTYNPYTMDTFQDTETGAPVTEAAYVLLDANGKAFYVAKG